MSSKPPWPSSNILRLCFIFFIFLSIIFKYNKFPDFSVRIIFSLSTKDKLQGLLKPLCNSSNLGSKASMLLKLNKNIKKKKYYFYHFIVINILYLFAY